LVIALGLGLSLSLSLSSCRRSTRGKNQPDSTEEAEEEKRAFIGLTKEPYKRYNVLQKRHII